MFNRRGFTATVFALLAGCGKPPQAPSETAVALSRAPHLTDADIEAFLSVVRKLPGQIPPAFQPVAEVDFTSDAKAGDIVSRWQREFRSSYNPAVQAKLWKRDSTLRAAFVDCGVEPESFGKLLVELATAVVRESLDPEIDLAALSRQADETIASLCSQFDGLDRDPRLSPTVRNSRAELLSAVLKETVAYREFLRLLEQVSPDSVAAIAPRREVLESLMPTTETVQLFRKKLQSQGGVIQASHKSVVRPRPRTK